MTGWRSPSSGLGRATPARLAVFNRLYAFAELDTALRRAWSGLDAAGSVAPGLIPQITAARAALRQYEPEALERSAEALLSHPDSGAAGDPAGSVRDVWGAYPAGAGGAGVAALWNRETRYRETRIVRLGR